MELWKILSVVILIILTSLLIYFYFIFNKAVKSNKNNTVNDSKKELLKPLYYIMGIELFIIIFALVIFLNQ